MRRDLRYTLIPEGTSDRALIPILTWVLEQQLIGIDATITASMVQSDRLPAGKMQTLRNRISTSIEVYPCDILFIHRDEDGQGVAHRQAEIEAAVSEASLPAEVSPIAVIPVQMTEAWLLLDERAIRKAAGFSNGRMPLNLPTATEIERRSNPKEILRDAIRSASGQTGRKLKSLNLAEARASIATHMEDLSQLRSLPSFQQLETHVATTVQRLLAQR